MTQQSNSEAQPTPGVFVVGEWAKFYEGEESRSVQITEVNGDEVTARVYGRPMTFTPRSSDGKFVKKGSPDHEVMPTMIAYIPPAEEKKAVTFKSALGFVWGMFWNVKS